MAIRFDEQKRCIVGELELQIGNSGLNSFCLSRTRLTFVAKWQHEGIQ